jgi:predicted MFS family arabinose efflux permease
MAVFRERLGRGAAYWLVGYALLSNMIGTNLPTPLYGVYRTEFGFSQATLTLIFAIYALAVIAALLLFGRLSDAYGRRPLLMIGLLLAAAGSVLFALAQGVVWLFVARAVQGLAAGIVSGTVIAALVELQPRADKRHAALIATLAQAGGTALGPPLAGVLAQYAPLPTVLPYLIQLLLLTPALMAAWAMPETVEEAGSGSVTWRPRKPEVPAGIRVTFAFASAAVFVAWAVTGLYLSLVPSYVANLFQADNLALEGGVVFVMLGASSAAQVLLRRTPSQTAITSGLLMLAVGLGGIVLAVPLGSLWLLLLATLLSGIGHGLAFLGSQNAVGGVAPSERRAEVNSSFYLAVYLGVGLPVVGTGLAANLVGLYPAVAAFAAVIGTFGLLTVLLVATTGGEFVRS